MFQTLGCHGLLAMNPMFAKATAAAAFLLVVIIII